MFAKILGALRQVGLMTGIESKTREMLQLGRGMVSDGLIAVLEAKLPESDIYATDQRLNGLTVDVRRMLVQRMAVSQGTGVDAEIVFLKVATDLERVGDYAKNLVDLARQYEKPLPDSEWRSRLEGVMPTIDQAFPRTEKALFDCSEQAALAVIAGHHKVSQAAKGVVAELLQADDVPGPDAAAFALFCRHIRRISAHLKNVSTTAINPFHHVGYWMPADEEETGD